MTELSEHRVLVLHNRYRVAGGEERFAAQLVDDLFQTSGPVLDQVANGKAVERVAVHAFFLLRSVHISSLSY